MTKKKVKLNRERGNRMLPIVEAYNNEFTCSGEDLQTALQDMLTDLRHFADVHALDFGAADDMAHHHYVAEIEEVK